MRNERRAEYFGYISSCQLPVFGRPSHGGWIICLLHFSAVASSHWVGNEKRQFQMPVFASFIFVIIIYCLSLTVSVFSPVVPLFVSKPEIVKNVFYFSFWGFCGLAVLIFIFLVAMESWESTKHRETDIHMMTVFVLVYCCSFSDFFWL